MSQDLKLLALEYAEKIKKVNEPIMSAYKAGYNYYQNLPMSERLSYIAKKYLFEYTTTDQDIGYSDLRGENAKNREKLGNDCKEIHDKIMEAVEMIVKLNRKHLL